MWINISTSTLRAVWILMIAIMLTQALPQKKGKASSSASSTSKPAAGTKSSVPAPKNTPKTAAGKNSPVPAPNNPPKSAADSAPKPASDSGKPPPPGPYAGGLQKFHDEAQRAVKDKSYSWAPTTLQAAKNDLNSYQDRVGPGYVPPPVEKPMPGDPNKPFARKHNNLDGLGSGWKSDPKTGQINPETGKPYPMQMSSYPTKGSVKNMNNRAQQDPSLREAAEQRRSDRENVMANQGLPPDSPNDYKYVHPED